MRSVTLASGPLRVISMSSRVTARGAPSSMRSTAVSLGPVRSATAWIASVASRS